LTHLVGEEDDTTVGDLIADTEAAQVTDLTEYREIEACAPSSTR
jgi:hypothetical protein